MELSESFSNKARIGNIHEKLGGLYKIMDIRNKAFEHLSNALTLYRESELDNYEQIQKVQELLDELEEGDSV